MPGRPVMIPVTGAQYEIAAGDYRAMITELGAGLRGLWHRGMAVTSGYGPDELAPGGAGQLLLPWPNRVDGGRYTMDGTPYQLDLSEPAHGNAIHGLTRWAPWAVLRHAPEAVLMGHALLGRQGYPFCLDIEVEYALSADAGLQVSITATNTGSRPAPYGTGSHPYLTAGTTLVDDCVLTLPAAQLLPADDRGIPAGPVQDVTGTPFDFREPRPVGVVRLDHALTGLVRDASGRAWASLAAGEARASLWAGPGYRWLQVFTGDTLEPGLRRRALAIEPMTCPPNAFASGTDLLTLEPGDVVTHTWGIEVSAPAG